MFDQISGDNGPAKLHIKLAITHREPGVSESKYSKTSEQRMIQPVGWAANEELWR